MKEITDINKLLANYFFLLHVSAIDA